VWDGQEEEEEEEEVVEVEVKVEVPPGWRRRSILG
jgi:hypothetical protein